MGTLGLPPRNFFLQNSKTGKKPIYLSEAALDVLKSIPRIAGNPHIIPGRKAGAPRSDLKRPWAAICKAAKLDARRHDLRHSFASVGVGGSMGLPIIGKLLGHKRPQTTARYAHLDADPLHRATNAISLNISAAMGSGKVILAQAKDPALKATQNRGQPEYSS
jgi:integrase